MSAFPAKSLTGSQYGRLKVLEFIPNGKKASYYRCQCECGNEKVIQGSSLTSGNTISCGCATFGRKRKSYLAAGLSGLRMLLSAYKKEARAREVSWGLTEEEFKTLTSKMCVYCGTEPRQLIPNKMNKNHTSQYVYNGVDRVDNESGYTPENCVSCCKICNRAKGSATVQEWDSWLNRVVRFRSTEC